MVPDFVRNICDETHLSTLKNIVIWKQNTKCVRNTLFLQYSFLAFLNLHSSHPPILEIHFAYGCSLSLSVDARVWRTNDIPCVIIENRPYNVIMCACLTRVCTMREFKHSTRSAWLELYCKMQRASETMTKIYIQWAFNTLVFSHLNLINLVKTLKLHIVTNVKATEHS